VAVAILAAHLQCSDRRGKCVNAGYISSVSNIHNHKLEDGAQFAIRIATRAALRDSSGDEQHPWGLNTIVLVPAQLA